MPPKEDRKFIQDESANMTAIEKNLQLSAELATAPNNRRQIYRIDRVEVGAKGWWICYRTGTSG